jgi:hypothetical protein
MSESTGAMEQFNINELAGATGLILGAVSGILVVIFKSRCFCKFRVGISDKYSLCMCERKPPPDSPRDVEEEDNEKDPTLKVEKEEKQDDKVDRTSHEKPREPEPEPEQLIPNKKDIDNLV